jgi:GNAT superfamily N-acetyltransferase
MAHIRLATLSDATSLFELVRVFPTPTPPDVDAFVLALRAKLDDPSSYLAVAEYEGVIVGYVSGDAHPTFYAGGSTAWVDEVLVLDAFRRQGIGRDLMAAFEAWAATLECKLVSLATRGAGPFY